MKVAIIMGSTSDLPKVEPAISILKNYGVEVNVRCLSAHRAHLGLSSFIKETETDGTEVIIRNGCFIIHCSNAFGYSSSNRCY